VLLVADEVVCGFGRLGSAFGAQHYGIEPDLMTVAKGLTSGYFPVSAAIVSDRVWQVLEAGSAQHGAFAHGHTTSLHPVGAAAALANLDILERAGLTERAARIGPGFQRALRQRFSDHPLVGDVRGVGLVAGIELVADRESRRPFAAAQRVGTRAVALCRSEGLVARALGDTLALCPPLVISPDELDQIVQRMSAALDRLHHELHNDPSAGTSP
jgi:L-2,4-diaminobutyrate transaminase